MIKTFCDVCEREIPDDLPYKTIRRKRGDAVIEIKVGRIIDGTITWNTGHTCPSCAILTAIHGENINTTGKVIDDILRTKSIKPTYRFPKFNLKEYKKGEGIDYSPCGGRKVGE